MLKLVISASRRTDIPAFYMPWFMRAIGNGYFNVINPYNHKLFQVPASPDQVHAIVFWSKDFGPFLDSGNGEKLVRMGYHLLFNFTINSPNKILEPRLPTLQERLSQLKRLCRTFGPASIHWRFDPICIFKDKSGRCRDNLSHFHHIAKRAADLGIATCITSFVDHYQKVQRRFKAHSDIVLLDPTLSEKKRLIAELAGNLSRMNMQLHLCCEKDLLEYLPADAPVSQASCIPNQRIIDLYGPGISVSKDKGQRRSAGCGCSVSKDIGSYTLHPCHHNCLYCYANPAADRRNKQS
jgi:hypothetical protein